MSTPNDPTNGFLSPVRTSIRDLNALTGGGLRPGTLTVIASRPAMGRTTLLADICRHITIRDNTPCAVWTLEEERDDYSSRLISAEARVPLHRLRSHQLTEDEWERVARSMPVLTDSPLYIDAAPSITTAELTKQATNLVENHDVALIAVDGIQDIRPEQRSDLREREVGDVVRDLKTLARELQVPVLATSHLNRGPEHRIGHRPQLDDLRESGAITFAADLILLLHREDYYEPESPNAGVAEVLVAKHRHGPKALIWLAYQPHYGRFVNLPEDFAPVRPSAPAFDLTDAFAPKDS